jgi:nucleoside-diphosphate-sugar epimerase
VRIFITGANGFIGSNICRHFRARGWDVHGLVRKSSDLHNLTGVDVALRFGDLQDRDSFAIPEDTDYIVHAASITSDLADDETCRKNILLLTVNLAGKLLDMPRPPKRLVYISTALTLGFGASDISESHPGTPADFLPYTRYKIASEKFLTTQWKERGLPVVILRPADVFGPYDRTSSARILRECERGVPLIAGRGNHRFGYCYSGNLCQAVELALRKEGIEGRAYSVTNGELPTWREFFTGFQRALGRTQRVYVPVWLAFAAAGGMTIVRKFRPRYEPTLTYYRIKRITTETTYDISRTVADLGYVPDDRTERQIGEIVAWYLQEKKDGFIK